MKSLTVTASIGLALFCGGCADKPDIYAPTTPTATREDFERAKAHCQMQSNVVGSDYNTFQLCMRERGWVLQPPQ